ncbi:hypothetical protein JOM56_002861 [Amanita muscaria]
MPFSLTRSTLPSFHQTLLFKSLQRGHRGASALWRRTRRAFLASQVALLSNIPSRTSSSSSIPDFSVNPPSSLYTTTTWTGNPINSTSSDCCKDIIYRLKGNSTTAGWPRKLCGNQSLISSVRLQLKQFIKFSEWQAAVRRTVTLLFRTAAMRICKIALFAT